ncbi:MAG: T9SS type A sorting domain-containing protein [Bacteroidota bacterium]
MNVKYLIALFILFFLKQSLHAQTEGCTDPLATNYNPNANKNNGSCVYADTSMVPYSSVNLDAKVIETSGLIKWNNHIWTHNDNDDLKLYALDTIDGSISQSITLTNTYNTDWEEISQDANYLYVGDFGNNNTGVRQNLRIFRINKTSILNNSPIVDTIKFSYSNQIDFTPNRANKTDFDCEAFIVSSDSIYLFTKQWQSNQTSLYVLPKIPGTHSARLKETLNVQGLITGASYVESKRMIALCGYSSLLQPFLYLLYDFKGDDFFAANKRKIVLSLPFHQIEGIASSDGLKYYLSNEYFSRGSFVTVNQKMHILDMSGLLDRYINNRTSGFTKIKKKDNFIVYPNPSKEKILVNLDLEVKCYPFVILNSIGEEILKGFIKSVNDEIDISNLSVGIYTLLIDGTYSFRIEKQ